MINTNYHDTIFFFVKLPQKMFVLKLYSNARPRSSNLMYFITKVEVKKRKFRMWTISLLVSTKLTSHMTEFLAFDFIRNPFGVIYSQEYFSKKKRLHLGPIITY